MNQVGMVPSADESDYGVNARFTRRGDYSRDFGNIESTDSSTFQSFSMDGRENVPESLRFGFDSKLLRNPGYAPNCSIKTILALSRMIKGLLQKQLKQQQNFYALFAIKLNSSNRIRQKLAKYQIAVGIHLALY